MRTQFLPFAWPAIGDEEVAAVADAMRSGWLTGGPRVREFEASFARTVCAEATLAVSSCTAALHLALLAHGVGPGDEVITTTMTFAATVNVIEHVGAVPVLADVERDTLNIDPRSVERAISERTKAVIIVHYGGHPADLSSLDALCELHDLALIEDAAHALPASSGGRVIGSGRNLTAFSFYATKNLTTGEGGMLTGSSELIERVRPLALHGMSRDAWRRYERGGSWRYDVIAPGFKYNMTDPAAAMGLVQLRRLEAMQLRRNRIVDMYTDAFGENPSLEPPSVRPGVQHAHHLYPLRLRLEHLDVDRDRIIVELAERNIGTSVHFIPIHEHSCYRNKYGYRPEDFPVAHEAFSRLVSLPLHPGLSDGDVEDVVEALKDVLGNHAR